MVASDRFDAYCNVAGDKLAGKVKAMAASGLTSFRKKVASAVRKVVGEAQYFAARNALKASIRRTLGDRTYLRARYGFTAEYSCLPHLHGLIHVGAHIGQERDLYSAFDLDVVWIEPIPAVFEKLQNNIAEFQRQRAFNRLLGEEDGAERTLYVSDNDGQSSSILEPWEHKKMYPDVGFPEIIALKTVTLETMLQQERIDIRKFDGLILDTQGSELGILRGAANLVRHFRFVKVEVPDFESYEGCCLLSDVNLFMDCCGFKEFSRHLIKHTPGIGSYFDVTYKRTTSLRRARARDRARTS